MIHNGLRLNNCIIRPRGRVKTFITLENENSKNIDIDEFDFNSLFKIIEDNYKSYSIIIDSRLLFLILVANIKFPNFLLVYNVELLALNSTSSFLSLKNRTVPESAIFKKVNFLYLFVNWFINRPSLKWNTEKAIKFAEIDSNLINLLIDYIGIRKIEEVSIDCISLINSIAKANFIFPPDCFKKFSIETIYTALTIMKNSGEILLNFSN